MVRLGHNAIVNLRNGQGWSITSADPQKATIREDPGSPAAERHAFFIDGKSAGKTQIREFLLAADLLGISWT